MTTPELLIAAWLVERPAGNGEQPFFELRYDEPRTPYLSGTKPLTDHTAATTALKVAQERIAELERENRILTAKTTNSLANNLCPDHRDKQAGKRCLACGIESAERDAARYRWLRQQHWDEAGIACVVNPKLAIKLGYDCPSLERLDAAVNAAMGQKRSDSAEAEKQNPPESLGIGRGL